MNNRLKQKGFTLIEVLVALLILTIAFTALFETTKSNIESSADLKKSVVAEWVAMNVFSEIQLRMIALPNEMSVFGTSTILGDTYTWQISTNSTMNNGIIEVDISIDQGQRRYQYFRGFIKP